MDSKKLSSDFHDSVGKNGLSVCSKKAWDRAILKKVKTILHKEQKILDVGCGYGRIAVPLLTEGYDIYGIDLSERLVHELKRGLASEGLQKRFKVADMCRLPFRKESFDVVLCLWSSFDSLLYRKEQVQAVKEMYRVLKTDGFAFIEGFTYMEPTQDDIRDRKLCGYGQRIRRDYINSGTAYYHYNHDDASLKKVLTQARVKKFSISEEWFGWRERLIMKFRKS